MQKDVGTEDDEDESEKNPRNDRCDFHSLNVTWSRFEIPILKFRQAEGDGRNCSDPSSIEDRFQHRFGFEDFVGESASGAGMFFVIDVYSFHCIDDLVERSKR